MKDEIKIITLGDIFKNIETEEKAFKFKDYITNLQKENDRLNNIVIEVKRYIEEDIKGNYFKRYDDEVYKLCDELLNMLDKENKYE